MNPPEVLYTAEAAGDTIEALVVEQGRDRPVIFSLIILILGGALASLPFIKVDLSVTARGIVRLSADDGTDQPGGPADAAPPPPVTVDAFLGEREAKYLQAGQHAILQYDAFPFNEWGSASGTVADLSDEPIHLGQLGRDRFVVDSPVRQLHLPDGRTGRIADGMLVTVRVVVNRKSLLQLIYQRSEDLFGA